MQPTNTQPLVTYGDSFKRLGDTKRVEPYSKLANIENLIRENCLLTASADITPTQPPFFTEFTYCDLLGGMMLRTFSAEINTRLAQNIPDYSADLNHLENFKSGLKDKYKLKSSDLKYKRIVFLPGHNIFDRMVDTNMLYKIMDSDKSVMIKPHPISNEEFLRNLGSNFGYSRILDKDISAYDLIDNVDEIISVTSSEISLIAILYEKKLTDITNYMNSWAGMSYPFLRDLENIKSPKEKVKRLMDLLLSPSSGFILPSMSDSEICSRINKYCELALLERKPFEMITSQRLSIVFARPERTPKDKNEIIQSRQQR